MQNNSIVKTTDYTPVINLVLDSVPSPHSRRAYERALVDFMAWYQSAGYNGLSKAVVQRYRVEVLESHNLAPSTINQRLCALRKLASEANDNGLIKNTVAAGISRVKGVTQQGVRAGNWLSREQAQALLEAPNPNTLKGKRDRAILAVMLACGLRREEVSNLTFEHVQLRDNRWCIVDILGKHGRVRTIPMPAWTKTTIDTWAQAAGISTGRIFRAVYCYGKTMQPTSKGISSQVIYKILKDYSHGIAPHDLRRSFARLARKGGSPLEQISLSLGHADLKTTMRYLGTIQDLTDAPCDHVGIRI